MKEKKKMLPILLVVLVIMVAITVGVSFAIWQITLKQETSNVITTGCFNVAFTDLNPIHLDKAYPISDEEGKSLVPYEFTITNTCDSPASYQVNLEILEESTLKDLDSVRVLLNESTQEGISNILTANTSVEPVLPLQDGDPIAIDSYKLLNGILKGNEEITYNLRLWIDEDTPSLDTYMGKTMLSKITVTTSLSQIKEPDAVNAVEYITNLATSGNEELVYDGTVDNNLRYIGADPNNYVEFNGELWRVIGSFNNIDDGNGNLETRLKLIRNESIGEYSWDTSDSSVNSGYGVNEWNGSSVNILLNDYYYNSKSDQTCYVDKEFGSEPCDFSDIGLHDESKIFIDDAVWHTGSTDSDELLTSEYYEIERSSDTTQVCNSRTDCSEMVDRTTSWVGKVGLIYFSDYGFATSGSDTVDRDACLSAQVAKDDWYDAEKLMDCSHNSWLYKATTDSSLIYTVSNGALWTMTINSKTSGNSIFPACRYLMVTKVDGKYLSNPLAFKAHKVSPVVFLKSNVNISSGEGSMENPFTLSLK